MAKLGVRFFGFLLYIFRGEIILGQNIGNIEVSDEMQQCYSMEGDVNIAYLTTIRGFGASFDTCSPSLASTDRLQYVEAVRYVIEEVNRNPHILPNITMGFVGLDACERDLTALTQAMRLLPLAETTDNSSRSCGDGFSPHHVVGVLGPRASRMSVMVSSVLGIFHIPVLATFSTSDELSDKSRFPYFMRLVPPDRFQAKAIVDFVVHFGWRYMSLVYSTGSYGENGAKRIEIEAKKQEICLAYAGKIPSDGTEQDYDAIVSSVFAVPNAKAVIVFLSTFDGRGFFRSVGKLQGSLSEFLWIGGDDLQYEFYGAPSNGMFTFHFSTGEPTEFFQRYLDLTPDNNPGNPWMHALWEMLFDCQWDSVDSGRRCNDYSNRTARNQELKQTVTIPMDGVYVYAYAFHNLISDRCPEAFTEPTIAQDCILAGDLLTYMKEVEFQGWSSQIKFDQTGDMLGQYEITQYVRTANGSENYRISVARWDKDTEVLTVEEDLIQWNMFNVEMGELYPKSICSQPCGKKQIYIYKELHCCWECRKCRDNERITSNVSECERCPPNTWPDSDTATFCEPIPPVFVQWSDAFAISLVCLTCLGILILLVTFAIFLLKWSSRLIKASSRQLSVMTLLGIFLAFMTVFTFLTKPTQLSCQLGRYGFNLSVAIIYSPLLVKTNRLYRIFTSGKQGRKSLRLIGNRFQMLLSSFLVLIQVILSLVVGFLSPIKTKLRMPVATEPQVELYCDSTLLGLLAPLAYNLVIIIVTAVHGFLTRKYPENFNESWHIFISVATATFLWAVFLPTYFTTFYGYNRAVLLAFCLFLNASVTLLCLFVPKVYAVYFVAEDKLALDITASKIGPVETKGVN